MWIRMKDSGQEVDMQWLQAKRFILQGDAVEIPTPKPRKEEKKANGHTAVTETPNSEAARICYRIGFPWAAQPFILRMLELERRVAELEGVNERRVATELSLLKKGEVKNDNGRHRNQ